MAQESQFLRLAGGPLDDPELAALLDPAALEKRLSEARTRRSAALARRATGAADPAAAPDADAAPVAATLRGWLLSLIFALGIGLGAAAVALLAQPGLRRGVALVISPEIAAETAPGTDRDTAPDIEPALARAPAPVATAPPAPAPLPAEAPAPVQASPIQAPVAAPQPYPAAPAQPPAPDPVAPLPARVVIHYPASALQEARNARDALVAAGASAIEIVPVSLEIGADYRLVAVAETADEEHAQVLQDELKKALDAVAGNLFVRMLGVSKLIGQLRVSHETSHVFLRGNVAELDFNTVIERVESALELAAGAGSLGGAQ